MKDSWVRIGAYEKQKFNYREDYNVIEELKNEETKQDEVAGCGKVAGDPPDAGR